MRRLLLAFLLTIAFAHQLTADCIATLVTQWSQANDYTLTCDYHGSNGTPGQCVGIFLYRRLDGGTWDGVSGSNGVSESNVHQTAGFPCWTEGTHTVDFRVDCNQLVNGSCVPGNTAYAQSTVTVTHGVAVGAHTADRVHD